MCTTTNFHLYTDKNSDSYAGDNEYFHKNADRNRDVNTDNIADRDMDKDTHRDRNADKYSTTD